MFSFLFGVFVLSMLEKIIYIKFYIIFFERKIFNVLELL